MQKLTIHGPVFLWLQGLTFLCFGSLMRTPIWHGMDGEIIREAYALNLDPGAMFGHLGFYFSQPLLQLAFLLEYRLFGLHTAGYIGTNLFVHACNAFIIYMLVNMLFPRKHMAMMAASLFVLGVGSYGKTFMAIYQLESLLVAGFHLMVLYFFIRNDFRHEGRLFSPYLIVGLLLFLLAGMTKATSFSLILSLAAYKAFFNPLRRGRVFLSVDLLLLVAVGIAFHYAQATWGFREPSVFQATVAPKYYSLMSIKNIFRYLNLMFFPLQQSPILETSPGWLIVLFHARTVIRVFLTLSIISYSFFGFVFGSRAIRFFIAWTFISLLPFTAHTESGIWLNLRHLYLTSLGFCVILAAGVDGTKGLLAAKRRVRYVPYLLPLVFVAMSLGLTHKLNRSNQIKATEPEAVLMRQIVAETCR
ncbi:hypothetical protein COW53_03730 [bacterium CG17_big_fil_post_rev_8_21_14_2_50_64_8]|nr:MAG: hypothetical protein COW53_03730 [bacterium CG17_big_fil_post_rev_8_21_14_2_50_64_8]PJA74558.1 MAG: hypothetical protein CO151_09285 [bacterium CG_4_9_14_3_um_filter_65_15]